MVALELSSDFATPRPVFTYIAGTHGDEPSGRYVNTPHEQSLFRMPRQGGGGGRRDTRDAPQLHARLLHTRTTRSIPIASYLSGHIPVYM